MINIQQLQLKIEFEKEEPILFLASKKMQHKGYWVRYILEGVMENLDMFGHGNATQAFGIRTW